MKKTNLIKHVALAASAGLLFTACSSTREYEVDEYSYYPSSSTSESSNQSSSEQSSVATESSGSSQDRDQINIPLHEERVNVGKRTVDAGQVTLRKIVTTETVNQPVQLRKESLVIDRTSSDGQRSMTSSSGGGIGSGGRTSSDWQPGAQNRSDSERSSDQPAAQASAQNDSVNESAGAESQSNANQSSADAGQAFQEETFTIRLQEEQPMIEKNIVETGRVTARKNSQTQQQNVQQQVRREDVKLDSSGAQNVEIRGTFDTAVRINESSGAERPSSIQHQDSSEGQKSEDKTPTKGQGAEDIQNLPAEDQSQPQNDAQSGQQQQQNPTP